MGERKKASTKENSAKQNLPRPTPQFNKTYWRKSSQWFMLNRPHAEAVLEDVQVFRA